MSTALPCPENLIQFQPVTSAEVNRVLDCCMATTSSLDPCLAWWLKEARPVTVIGLLPLSMGLLLRTGYPLPSRRHSFRPIQKKPNLPADDINNHRPITIIAYTYEQAGGESGGGSASGTSGGDQCPRSIPVRVQAMPQHGDCTGRPAKLRETDRGKTSLVVLLDLSMAFNTVDHDMLLGRFSGLGIRGQALAWLRSFLEDYLQKV